jgi:hypothetical protein
MELNGLDSLGTMTDAGHRSIIEMTMSDFEIGWESLLFHGIAMIL